MGRGASVLMADPWQPEQEHPAGDPVAVAGSWLLSLPDEQRSLAESLPLRRDLVTLLAYLRDNRVTGTQATGNLPLKAVREIAARLVDPPELDRTFAGHVYRVRSEDDVRPLYFRHVLAVAGGLAAGGMGRRWRLTALGERFLTVLAPLQVWLLFDGWWSFANWAVVPRYGLEYGQVPAGFKQRTLNHLLDLSPGDWTPFEPFAGRLIEATGLAWPIQNQEWAHRILQAVIERMVVDPMIAFAALEAEYRPHATLGEEFPELSAIRVTPFGRGLLNLLTPAV